MSVAPRWKRRADEIAEAIGDELSVNGTVSIGNDVSLSVATISALANAITSVLNPTTIARAMWTSDSGATHDARAVYTSDGGGYWSLTVIGGVAGAFGSSTFIYQTDGTTTISARSGAEDRHEDVIFLNNVWQLPIAIVRDVNVVSTNTTPVHVQVRNIAGGFTAMGSDISTSMKLSAQPVSIADTVNVKTATNEAVAITGTVNANVGGITLPISNPNNITVPVVNTNSVTVPVSLGSVTVPIKATTSGIPQNASGVSVYVPVDGNHSVTVPVSAGSTTVPASVPSGLTVPASVPSGLTVPVAVGSNTVPVAVGSATVPVAVGSVVVPVRTVTGTTNAADGTGAAVVVPVTASGTVLDVNIATVAAIAKTSFHEAMEEALDDATDINTVGQAGLYYGTVVSYGSTYFTIKDTGGTSVSGNAIHKTGTGDSITRTGNTISEVSQMTGLRVYTASSDYATVARNWYTVDNFDPNNSLSGTIHWTSGSGTNGWIIIDDFGIEHTGQTIYQNKTAQNINTANTFVGYRVHRKPGFTWWQTEKI